MRALDRMSDTDGLQQQIFASGDIHASATPWWKAGTPANRPVMDGTRMTVTIQ